MLLKLGADVSGKAVRLSCGNCSGFNWDTADRLAKFGKTNRTSRDVQGQYRTTVQQVASLNKKQMSTNDAQIR